MNLNDEQIQVLFDFTKRKLVHYYDLQIELVDHLAANIEEEIEKDKKLNFDGALDKVYKKFGIFGFSKIVQEKEKQLHKQSLRNFYRECLNLFQWPQVVGSVTIFAAIYTLCHSLNDFYLRIIFGILVLSLLTVNVILFKKYRKPAKQLLMMQYHTPAFNSIWAYFYLQFLIDDLNMKPMFFTLLNFVGIIFLIASFQLNKKVRDKAKKLYPEAFA